MSLEVGDKVGLNRYGMKTDFIPEVGDRFVSFGNRAVSTKTLEVGDRFAYRKHGYKSSGEVSTTCWKQIGQLVLELGVSTATIHQDYTDDEIYRYLYNRYDGQYGDAYATIAFYPKSGKVYCLGTVTGGTASSAMTNIPDGCDIYLFVNGELVDYILHNEYSATNTKRLGGLDNYLTKTPGGGIANTISLYLRPYDGITTAKTVTVELLENDNETCLSQVRQTPGYFVTNAWKMNDAVTKNAPIIEYTPWQTVPWSYDEYSLEFEAVDGRIYTFMDFWTYENTTTKYHTEHTYTAAYGFQWKYPYMSFSTFSAMNTDNYYTVALWLNPDGDFTLSGYAEGHHCILSRGYSPYLDWCYMGVEDNFNRVNTARGLVYGQTNELVVRYPWDYSKHYWYQGQEYTSLMPVEYSALYLVELQSARIL